MCPGESDDYKEIDSCGECGIEETYGFLNSSAELCLSYSVTIAKTGFSEGTFLIESSAETSIFYSVENEKAKKALLKVISHAMTIDKTEGSYCVKKSTLAVTSPPCDAETTDSYHCDNGFCVKEEDEPFSHFPIFSC